jgi:hypothetical protein
MADEIEALYRQHGDTLVIEIVLNSVMQIYNSLDPSPFKERELNGNAEEYIYNAVDEIPRKKPIEMVVYLPEQEITHDTAITLPASIRNHFEYKSALSVREFSRLMRRGRFVLVIALITLFFCLSARQVIPSYLGTQPGAVMLEEALLINGWAAMWEPVTIFFYDWWPIKQKQQVYDRVIKMDISVKPWKSLLSRQ